MSNSNFGPADKRQRLREPRADEVVAQMEKILASSDFAQSDRLQKFIRFIVEETLSGRGASLKEYTIALEVFERSDSFDPQTSSVVRVEASRLRAKLEKYNAVKGRNDPVRIVLPAGGYVPAFRAAGPDTELIAKQSDAVPLHGKRGPKRRQIAALLVLIFVGVGTAAVLLTNVAPFRSTTDSSLEAPRPTDTYSIAVLPLRDLSAGQTNDYFSLGMTDALITRLAQDGSVRVISMTSVMRYKNVNRSLVDIGRELGVSHVIEGSVLRVGNKVRITAQLIEAATDSHVWADSYERNFADVLALQEEVVERIVSSLLEDSPPTRQATAKSSVVVDPDAYDAYLKGRFFLNKTTVDGFRRGIAYFKQAIDKAPDFAPAHSGMATCFCLLGGHGFEIVRPREGMPTAKVAVLEALRLDDTLAEPHAFLGIIRLKYEWDWPGAEQAFRRSIELNPSYARARVFYSVYLEAMGRQDEAIREAEEARLNDPVSLAVNVNLGWQNLQAGQLEQAKRIFEYTTELDASFWGAHWGLGQYHRRKGDYAEAIAAFQRALAAGGGHAMPFSALGHTYAIAGQPVAAREMLDKLTKLTEESYVSPVNMAIIHAGLGDKEQAFALLEQAYADRSRSMAWLNVISELDGLRSDPRLDSLLRRVGLPN